MLKSKFNAPTFFLTFRGIFPKISKLCPYMWWNSVLIHLPIFGIFDTFKSSFYNFLIFFVYQHWIWFFGGILSTKGFDENLVKFRWKFFKAMSAQNVRTVGKIFTPIFIQLCHDFHRVCPWLAYNNTMTSNPITLKFVQQQWLQYSKITSSTYANCQLKTEMNRDCNKFY